MDLTVIAGQLTYIERLYVYHYYPGRVVLWISLSGWEPPESPLGFLIGEGKPISLKEIVKRAQRFGVDCIVIDGHPEYRVVEELIEEGFGVVVRSDEPLKLPKGSALLIHVSEEGHLKMALNEYDDVHVEAYIPTETLMPDSVPKDLPLHTFSWPVFVKLQKAGYHYVYNHAQPYREDTKCPKCGTPNAVREEGRLIGWDGPRCRKCGYTLHYHYSETEQKVPTSVHEWLSWRPFVPVL